MHRSTYEGWFKNEMEPRRKEWDAKGSCKQINWLKKYSNTDLKIGKSI
jgi:hypothetical protein